MSKLKGEALANYKADHKSDHNAETSEQTVKTDYKQAEDLAQIADKRAQRYGALAEKIDQKIGKIAAVRFVAFLVMSASFFSAWYDQAPLYFWLGLGGAVVFGITVWLHRTLYGLLPRAQAQRDMATESAARLRHQWSKLKEDGQRFAQGTLEEKELQIFGEVSLFKLLNRAHLRGAQALIARRLLQSAGTAPLDLEDLAQRQDAVKELVHLSGLRRKFLGATRLSHAESDARSQALGLRAFAQWAQSETLDPKDLKRLKILSILGLGLTLTTLIQAVISVSTDLQTAWQLTLGAQFVLYLVTTGKVSPHYVALITEAHKPLQGLEGCFQLVEKQEFNSPWLKQWSKQLKHSGTPSERIKNIARYAEALAVRHSALLYGVLAIGLLWELWYGTKVIEWRAQHGGLVSSDLKAIYEFEALCSFAEYAHDHPEFTWPQVSLDSPQFIHTQGIAHPLFPPQGRVSNDFDLLSDQEFYLITGSNMSGKSSFMRALASNITLALAGAPVCANQLICPPCSLATSIQVTDDPSRGWSRFYAEVRRISEVIKRAESASKQRPVLYLIDEMLSGTNSRERRLASRSIAARLIHASHAAGIITTHDLDLAQLSKRFPHELKLAHFSDRFDGDKLHFDYTLRSGVAQTTNALHVLSLEGIEVDETLSEL